MKKKANQAGSKQIPLTKSLGELMKDEDGFVSKETILKVGLSTVAALGVTATGYAGSSISLSHSNYIDLGPVDNCVNHHNVTSHSY